MATKKIIFGVSGLGFTSVLSYYFLKNKNEKQFTYEEVSKHNSLDKNIWVTYKKNVYDITKFIQYHPGGKDKIMLAAGKDLEPYWNIYRQHLNEDIINNILLPLKIGSLMDYDSNKYANTTDPYISDPKRNDLLKFHNLTPCNSEVPSKYLLDNYITPNNFWYIRNHNPVPIVDVNKFNLNINFQEKNFSLTLDQIKKLKPTKIISTIQCGGNRRSELNKLEKTSGTPWGIGAISTAEWKGVLLKDLLNHLGFTTEKINKNKVKHIHFEGIDGVRSSIPLEKVISNDGDVLLAFEMNGEILPRDHGFPLRVIVPGNVGIRNIKWLKKITLSGEEVDGPWQKSVAYKLIPNYIKNLNEINLEDIPPIQETPVQSCITDLNLLEINDKDKYIEIKGFAYSGGGRGINRVDVSIDDGKTWRIAELKRGQEQEYNRAWAWTFWELKIHITEIKQKKLKVICKAIDSSLNIQPEKIEYAWNIRGLNNNSWHRIESTINDKTF